MIQARTFGALLALGALTALPGCSMMGGGGGEHSSQAATSQYTAPASSRTAEAREQAQREQPITKEMIRKVQANLKHDGLYRGRVDGVWGPKSEQAAREFQEHNHMNPTGKIDLPMLQAMNLGNGDEQYGEGNGAMGGNAGPNTQGGSQQYDEANTGANNGPGPNGSKIGPSRNINAAGQDNASNMPYQPNTNATNAGGGAAGNGANSPNGTTGSMNTGAAPANNGTQQPQH